MHDIGRPYGGYPPALQAFGWTLFAVLVVLAPSTFWDRSPSTLPPIQLEEPLANGVTVLKTTEISMQLAGAGIDAVSVA